MESALAKRLAAVDKKERDAAFQQLTEWLEAQQDLSELELLKLWRALYYAYWLSDKQLVQQDLASKLAQLARALTSPELGIRYIHAFWQTMIGQWYQLDRHRLDKFYYLFRQMHAASFQLLEDSAYADDAMDLFVKAMVEGPLNATESRISDSLRYHAIEAYLPTLESSLAHPVPAEHFSTLIMPFVLLLGETSNRKVIERVNEHVIERMTEIVDGEIAAKKAGKVVVIDEVAEENEEDAADVLTTSPLQIYFPDIVSIMFDVASHADTPAPNRKRLYALVRTISARYAISLVDDDNDDEESEEADMSDDELAALAEISSRETAAAAGVKRKRDSDDDGSDLDDDMEEDAEDVGGDDDVDEADWENVKWEDLPSCSSDDEAEMAADAMLAGMDVPSDDESDELDEEAAASDEENEAPATSAPVIAVAAAAKKGKRAGGGANKQVPASPAPTKATDDARETPSKSVQFRMDKNEFKAFNRTEPSSRVSATKVQKETFPAPDLMPTPPAPRKSAQGRGSSKKSFGQPPQGMRSNVIPAPQGKTKGGKKSHKRARRA